MKSFKRAGQYNLKGKRCKALDCGCCDVIDLRIALDERLNKKALNDIIQSEFSRSFAAAARSAKADDNPARKEKNMPDDEMPDAGPDDTSPPYVAPDGGEVLPVLFPDTPIGDGFSNE